MLLRGHCKDRDHHPVRKRAGQLSLGRNYGTEVPWPRPGSSFGVFGFSVFITGQLPIRTELTKVGLPGATLTSACLPTVHGFDEFLGNNRLLAATGALELALAADLIVASASSDRRGQG